MAGFGAVRKKVCGKTWIRGSYPKKNDMLPKMRCGKLFRGETCLKKVLKRGGRTQKTFRKAESTKNEEKAEGDVGNRRKKRQLFLVYPHEFSTGCG